MKRLLGPIVTATLVSACSLPTAQGTAPATSPITGRVDFGDRTVQATIADVAIAATVSLISASTGVTVGTTVTRDNGTFTLSFGSAFTPQAGQTYYMEAVKGLSGNRAAEPALRVRTLLRYDAGWLSLSSLIPGSGIVINSSSTALSAIVSHKGLSNSAIASQMGSLDPTNYTPPDANITPSDFSTVRTLVQEAMGKNQDALEAIAYHDGTFSLANAPVFLDSLLPSTGAVGTTVVLHGAFPANTGDLIVLFNGDATASITALSTDARQLTVTVPSLPGAGVYPVSIRYGKANTLGQTFTVL